MATSAEQTLTTDVASWRALATAQALVAERVEAALAREGLPPLHWHDVLAALADAPQATLRMHELASEVVMSRSGLTRLVDRLEQAGLLERRRCPTDRRGAFVSLTAAGRATYERMLPAHAAAVREHFAAHVVDAPALTELLAPVIAAARATRAPCGSGCDGPA
jgi:DNA-binding MarR family transcriptional regulator